MGIQIIRKAAAGGAFSPSQLPGLQLWLDCDAIVPLAAEIYSSIPDRSSNANNASVPAGPTAIRLNGRRAARLSSSVTATTAGNVTFQTAKRGSIFVLFRPTALPLSTDVVVRGAGWFIQQSYNPTSGRFYAGNFSYQRTPDTVGAWEVCEITRSADTLTTVFMNGSPILGATDTTNYTFPAAQTLYTSGAVDIAEIIVCSSAITGTQRDQLYAYLAAKWNWQAANVRPQIICTGNSLTAGTGASDAAHSFPRQLAVLMPTWDVVNMGVSGVDTNYLISHDPIDLDAPLYGTSRKQNICVCWEITNDLVNGNHGTTATYNSVVQWCNDRRAAGWKVLVGTAIDRDPTNAASGGNASFATQRLAVNALVVANWATFADGLVDLAGNANLATNTNETYFDPDHVHLNDTGYGVVASLVQAAVLALQQGGVFLGSGWTANASVGDKTQAIANYSGSGLNGTMVSALNVVSAGTGTALAQDEARVQELVKKVQAIEAGLATTPAVRPNA